MALTPFSFGGSLLDPFAVAFEDPFFHSAALSPIGFTQRPSGAVTRSSPVFEYPMDIKETDAGYELVADAPGMRPDEIHVDFNEASRVLTLRGQHSEETKSTEPGTGKAGFKHMYRSERVKRSFLRSFTVPKDVNPEGIAAQLENGVLSVHIPKREAAQKPAPRKIPIMTGSAPGASAINTRHIGSTEEAAGGEEDQPMKSAGA
ncbi:hypothetical protein CEUSTIGMA_g2386.t1 [Chlamydomonas eustigma]|uniref:SHSP domain-containing protein n=1 Tax=Chlamydomonas eustigma TaxID=1157962 RepID=A0A250WWN9_9CHLO|nr:hypothetical protein CEUSTIGMA_g2386.t1 [Chlamydomonas eustigma]|eukprot:GAX74940.1 hypothetical protein CEUSTIGMA_g2386.t1 [Chlamydomonas eustigma]